MVTVDCSCMYMNATNAPLLLKENKGKVGAAFPESINILNCSHWAQRAILDKMNSNTLRTRSHT